MANPGIEMFTCEKKGRGLKATKSFESGKLITRQEPYAYVIMSQYAETVCHFCLATPGNPGMQPEPLLKCTACKYARYCNKSCQKKAWTEHKSECKGLQLVFPGQPVDHTRLVGRILWRREREGEEKSKTDEHFLNIEDLCDHLEKRTPEEKDSLDEKVFSFGHYFSFDKMPESDEKMLHLFAIIDCNAIGMNDSRGLQTIAVGIYPVISLLNHSCEPNCTAMNNGHKLEVRAMRKIESGEELCISYIDTMQVTKDRREKLEKQYYFHCECDMCENGNAREDLKHALVSDDIKEESIKYIEAFSRDMLKKVNYAKEKQNWNRMSNQAIGTIVQQDCVVADTNMWKIPMLNHAVEVQSYLRRPDSALEYAERVATAYDKLLPSIHPTLGMYLMRLGVLQWQLQKNLEAVQSLGRAANIIAKTFGEDHAVFKEILGLIHQCRMESHMSRGTQREVRLAKKKAGLGLPSAF